ncbi:hypothetical protein [Anaerotignum lactatifermentans]|uniref:hypothetical protein n=1 Tax=Anaerotignum lactatifermentans TaxID=160404 RepID=UPI002676CDC4|nr:hypothetical protein [Anaerotignum lactatifermentans]
MFNPIRNFGSADDVLKRAEKRQQEEEERRKRAAGPALPSGSPTLKNMVSANSKEALYVRKDDDLTPDQIIRKYQFVADDTSMDYDRKKEMIGDWKKSLHRLSKYANEEQGWGNYSQIMDLDAKLQSQLKSQAYGAGFFDSLNMGAYNKLMDKFSQKIGKPELGTMARKNQEYSEAAQKNHSAYATAGRVTGELAEAAAMYGSVGKLATAGAAKAASKVPKLASVANKNNLTKFGTELLAQQVADTAVMQHAVILQGVAEGKTRAEILEEMKQQAFTDLLFNAGMGVVGAGAKAIGKGVQARKAAKELAAQQAEETVKNVRPFQAGDMPLSDVDIQTDPIYRMLSEEQPKSMNEAFSGKGQTGNTVLHEKMNASGAAGTSKNISSMDLSSDMKNGLYGRTAGKNENPLLMPEARARLEEELRDLQDVDSLDQKYNEIFLREGEEAAEAFLKKNEQRKEEIMDMLYMPLKKEELQKQRINNALQKEVSSLLSYSGKENKKAAQEAIARAMMEVRRNGSVSEETRKKLFETLFDMGKATNRQNINQEVKDALKKSKFSISSQDAANIADFDTFRKNLMGKVGSVTKDGKNTRVDVAYQELSERFPEFFPDSIMHPAEQLRQIAKVAEDMKIQEFPLKDVTSAEEKELMMQEFLDKFSSAEKQYQNLVRFEAERKARQRQRILESGEDIDVSQLSVDEIQKLYDRKYQLQKKAERAKANKVLTEGDQAILQKFLHGEISEETIRNTPGVNADAVLEIAAAVKPYKKVSDLIGNSKKNNYEKRMQFIKDTVGDIQIGGKDGWKEKGSAWRMHIRTPERVIEEIAPKETAKRINDEIFVPIHENERDKTEWIRNIFDKVDELKIGKKKKFTVTVDNAPYKLSESGMVQYLGEKRFDLKKLENSTNLTAEEMKRMEQLRGEIKEAESQIDAAAMERINKGISEIQKIYKEIHPKINEVLIRNGYDPVGYIDGYFPHMFFDDPTDAIGKAMDKLGFNIGYTELPADIAGRTEVFRPGKKFSGNLLKREGTRTDYDALRGMQNYLYSVGDVIYHTDDIKTLRAFEDHVRYQLSPTAVKEEIDKVHNNFDLDLEQKRTELDKLYEKNKNLYKNEHNKTLQNFVSYLRTYTDLFAGKQHPIDRPFETNVFGRGIYNAANAYSQRLGANSVGANLSSALTGFIPLTQGFAPISMKNRLRGMKEGVVAVRMKKPDSLTRKSAFLTTRTNTKKLYQKLPGKIADMAFIPMEKVDQFATQSIWRGRYYDNINKGMNETEAIREADRYARDLFAGRSKGAVPPAFQSKMLKPLTMFQYEISNSYDFLFKNIPKEANGSKMRELRLFGEILVWSYAVNDLWEKATGSKPIFDPIGMALDTMADFEGVDVRNLVDILNDFAHGEGLQVTEEKEPKTGAMAVKNLGERLGQATPFFGSYLGGGRIPIARTLEPLENIPTYFGKWAAGEISGSDFLKQSGTEVADVGLSLIPPAGGNQIKKTAKGLKTMIDGGSYKTGSEGEKLQFAVDTKDPASWVKAALFGKWALPEGQAYISKEVNGLSEKRTEMQREMQQQFGTTPKAYFDTFQNINKAETREGKVSALKSSGLTDAEKEYIYKREIFTGKTQIEDFDKMRSFGLSFDQAAGAQTALEGIQKKYDEMLNDGLKDKNTLAANEKYNYISGMSIPSVQKQKMLENFAVATRWIPQDATPTLMNEKYQAVSGFMSVDDFEIVRGAVSDVISKEEWTKGLKNDRSRYIKAAIDQYTQGMPYAQKRELYKTFGVAKSLW